MEEIEITIVNWEKYQLRKDIKSPWWCAIDNELWRADEFSTFSSEEKIVWYALLQIASKARRSDITFKTLWVARCSGTQSKSVKNCIRKAKNLGWLYETRTDSVRNPSPTLHDITIQDDGESPSTGGIKIKQATIAAWSKKWGGDFINSTLPSVIAEIEEGNETFNSIPKIVRVRQMLEKRFRRESEKPKEQGSDVVLEVKNVF